MPTTSADGQTIKVPLQDSSSSLSASETKALSLITDSRPSKANTSTEVNRQISTPHSANLLHFLHNVSTALSDYSEENVALVVEETIQQATADTDFGGYGFSSMPDLTLAASDETNILFLLSAYLEAMKCAERSKSAPKQLNHRPAGRRGMTMTEKILAMHDVKHKGWVRPGEVVQVDVDWILASELSWSVSQKPNPCKGALLELMTHL
jgi:hypothetical protein